MSKEKELVPELRFPEYVKDEEWYDVSLGDVADVYQPKTISQEELFKEGFPVYGANGIIGFYDKFNHETRQIAIACRGSSCGTVNYTKPKSWITGNAMVVNVDEFDQVDKEFMFFQLDYSNLDYLVSGSGQPQITGNIKTHKVLLPPQKSEQQKIASCLSSLDELIQAETDKLEALTVHKKGLMQQLLPAKGKTVPELRFKEFEKDGEWVEDTLANIAGFRRGSFPQPYGLPEWYDDQHGMPFIQVFDVDDNFRLKPKTKRRISSLAVEQSVFIEKGTVIITIQGSIGRVAITQYDAYIDRTLLLFQEFYREIDTTFFAYVIYLLFEIEKQKAPGGIIKTITKEVLSDFLIKMPSIEEQQQIAFQLSSVDNKIAVEEDRKAAMQDFFKSMLHQLMSGQIRLLSDEGLPL